MSRRAWKWAFLVAVFGGLCGRTSAAACGNDIGAARADRMAMHYQRVNPSMQMSSAAMDCSTLSSTIQAFCGTSRDRPTYCGEYPALVLSKPTGIPPDLERIASTVAEDDQLSKKRISTMRDTFTVVTSLSTSVKGSKATTSAEQRSFAQRSTAGTSAAKRYRAA